MTIPPRKSKRPSPKPKPAPPASPPPLPSGLHLSDEAAAEMVAAITRTRKEWQRAFDEQESKWSQHTARSAQGGAEAAARYLSEHPEKIGSKIRVVSYLHRDPATNAVVGAGYSIVEDVPREASDEP